MTPRQQLEHLTRGTADVIPREELAAKLAAGRPLRVKLGVDPNFPDIHLGHTVALSKLRRFQELGHQAVLIIGDFTAMVGDPSGRSATRPQLTRDAVLRAAQTYEQQVFKVLDRARTEVRFNSEWLARMTFEDVLRLCAQTTVARMLERDDFAKRYAAEAPISIHEFMYPLMQAHDSVVVRADVELGGTDQTFNILLGRQLQKDAGQPPQVALILPLLEGTDGIQKMSKSLGNYIGVAEPPDEIFGKLMSISDTLMLRYYELLTGEDVAALRDGIGGGTLHPMDAKKRLGEMLVERFYDASAASAARRGFEERFQRGHVDVAGLPVVEFPATEKLSLPGMLVASGIVSSNSDARRLIRQQAVRINGEKVAGEEITRPGDEVLVEVGKRRAVQWRFK
jgi:tyrosyl-tRNA synthetase